jgi:predicted dithiol-disulfide oxidoreductase (DUF899 family)
MEHLHYPNESTEYTKGNACTASGPGGLEPGRNVFRKSDGEIRHFWGSEMGFAPTVPRQHHRAGDLVDPLWGLLDLTPEGRGDFFPKVNYDPAWIRRSATRRSADSLHTI